MTDLLPEVRRLRAQGLGNRKIAAELNIGRQAAERMLAKVELEEAKQMQPQGRYEIDVAACRPSRAAREIKSIHVEMLARSIEQLGLIQPISVRAVDGGFEVIAGLHRLRAFELLKRATIPAVVRHDDDLRAELALIDENLIRNELSPAERAIAISRRKAIYEALHPEIAHGGDRKSSRQVGDLNEPDRFTRATAAATNQSERTVQREAQRGQSVGEETLSKVVGTALDKGEEIDALAKLSPEKRSEIIGRAVAGEKVSAKLAVKQERREGREKMLGERQRALPDIKAGLILEDYEWDDEVWSRESGMDRHAANHYPTSEAAHTPEEIVARRPLDAIADKDSVLAMWSTVQHLAIALEVMKLRGFTYKSHYVWEKDRIGLGRWIRSIHEILLIGTRGSPPCPAPGTQYASVIKAPKGVHSAKPEVFLQMLEEHFPTLVKIELNRRGPPRPGWDAWGNETESPKAVSETASPGASPLIDSRREYRGGRCTPEAPAGPAADGPREPAAAGPANDDAGLDLPDFLRRAK